MDRYLRSPRLVTCGDGTATLHAIAWEAARERLLQWPIAGDGAIGPEHAHAPRERILELGRGSEPTASDALDVDLVEERLGHRAWVEHEAGVASVLVRSQGWGPLLVFRARGVAQSPALAEAPDGGLWIAFHHDLREDTGRADVAKWIALRYVDRAQRVLEPSAPMRDRDRDRAGIEQSFEFPALVVGGDGALALFGRGSHGFFRQELSRDGFGPRLALGDGSWGARGRHIAAAAVRDGIVIARRERSGIEVDLTPHVRGGPPALRRARVDWTEHHAHASARVECHDDPARAHGCMTLFGDLQQHSAHSDGLGSAHEVYLRARDRYGDDFVALTDHESFLGKRTGPGEWEYLQRVADLYDAPGRFVTLHGYEWTGAMHPGPGHKCVYFPGAGYPIVSRDEVSSGRALARRVHALGGFASPHHIGWTGADEAGHDDHTQPLWEICSCHGCYEHADHPLGQRGALREDMVDVMLRRGHRFGFTASSDSHGLLWHHGESRKRDPYRTGLTAVHARARTRQALFEALRARCCYATSGAKIWLDVRADGAPMGSELPEQTEAELRVHAVGTDAICELALIGAEGVLAVQEPHAHHAWLRARVASAFVYARVRQRDGEMAWSSPVFLGPRRRLSVRR